MRCQIWLVNPMDVILWTHRALLSATMLYGKFISYKMFSVAWSRISSKLLFLRFLPQGDISFPLSFRVHLNEAKYHRSPFRARATILYSTFYELVRFPPPFFQASNQKQTEVGSHRSGMWEAWQWSQKKLCWWGVKMAEEEDGEITFSSTNSSKEQENGEESLQNNFWSLAEDIRRPEKQPIVFEGR